MGHLGLQFFPGERPVYIRSLLNISHVPHPSQFQHISSSQSSAGKDALNFQIHNFSEDSIEMYIEILNLSCAGHWRVRYRHDPLFSALLANISST